VSQNDERDDGASPLPEAQDRALRAELDTLAPLLAMTRGDDQDRILDHAFTLVGLDPEWAVWLHYARRYLTEYRHRH